MSNDDKRTSAVQAAVDDDEPDEWWVQLIGVLQAEEVLMSNRRDKRIFSTGCAG
jgi:hypothetical protein